MRLYLIQLYTIQSENNKKLQIQQNNTDLETVSSFI